MRCLHARGFAVREHAAAALAVLHSPGALPAALRELLAMLPETPGRVRDFRANSVHGALMAMEQVLLRAVPAAPEGEQQAAVAVLTAALPGRLWLVDAARTTCPGVSGAFAHVLSACSGTAAVAGAPDALHAVLRAATAPHSYAPMYSLWLETAAAVLLPMLEGEGSLEHAAAAAAEGAEHPVPEVRMAALRWLEQASGAASWPAGVVDSVAAAARAQLWRGDNATATAAALAVLRSLVARGSVPESSDAGGNSGAVATEEGSEAVQGSAQQGSAGGGATDCCGDVSWEVTAQRLREAAAAVQSHDAAAVTLGALQLRAAVFGRWLAAHHDGLAVSTGPDSPAVGCGLCSSLHGPGSHACSVTGLPGRLSACVIIGAISPA